MPEAARYTVFSSCLSILFEVPEETLKEKIVQFRKMGCTLFADGNR